MRLREASRRHACREPAQTNAYLNNFDSALQLEIAAADIKPGERCCWWAAAPCSTTALALVARLSATVICYDCDPAAQRFARRLTRHLGCHGKSSASIN